MISLVVATRRSPLALAQTRAFCRALKESNPGLEIEELQVVTTGDRIQDRPLTEIGGKGLFVREIEQALLEQRADFAVHSMKDLPAHQPEGLVLGCLPERADPHDVLLVRGGEPTIAALPARATVGSSSQRRRLSLLSRRPDLQVQPLRGNVDTRVGKLRAGVVDAIVLAAAGLARLGMEIDLPKAIIHDTDMLPAVAQGTLAIQTRRDDTRVLEVLQCLDHPPTRLRAAAERGVLEALDADCTVPLAAFAELVAAESQLAADWQVSGVGLHLRAQLWSPDGSLFVEQSRQALVHTESDARLLGLSLGQALQAAL